MANPRIVFNPGSGSRNMNFPEELSDMTGPLRRRRVASNETQGGVVTVQFEFVNDEFEISLDGVPRNDAFEEENVVFWAHACRGGSFAFALDSADMALTNVRTTTAAGATSIGVDSVTGFVNSQKYLVESIQEGGYAQNPFVLNSTGAGPVMNIDRALAYGFAIGDRVRSRDYYPLCVVDQDENPLTLNDGSLTFSYKLKIRSYYDLVTA